MIHKSSGSTLKRSLVEKFQNQATGSVIILFLLQEMSTPLEVDNSLVGLFI